jgi:Arc/MetJ-type ribon-helix-helix transcriptional regulator
MAIPKIKATYSLDADTMRVLERVAKRWGISKSEALRRAVRALAATTGKSEPESALDELQAAAGVSSAQATRWVKEVRAERKADRPASRPGK